MNKNEFVGKIAAQAGVTATAAEEIIAAVFDTLTAATKAGDKVAWPGFGTFQVKSTCPAREGRNPSTGATIQIPETKVMHFGAAAGLKATLNP